MLRHLKQTHYMYYDCELSDSTPLMRQSAGSYPDAQLNTVAIGIRFGKVPFHIPSVASLPRIC